MTPEEEKQYAEDITKKITDTRTIVDTHGTELAEAKGQLAKVEKEVKEIAEKNKETQTLQETVSSDIKELKTGWKTLEESQKNIEEMIKMKLRPDEVDAKDKKEYAPLFNKQLKYYAYMAQKQPQMAQKFIMTEDEMKSYSKIIGEEQKYQEDFIKQREMDRKAMATTHMPRAGFLVTPTQYMTEIIDQAILEISPMEQFARQVTLPSNVQSVEWPVQSAHGVANWTYEQGTKTEDETATGKSKSFTLKQCYALYKVTQSMLNFSTIDLSAFLRQEYARAMAYLIGGALIDGSGVGQPEGILTNSSIASVNQEETTAITKLDNIMKLYFDLKAPYRAGSRWCFNSLTAWHLSKVKDGESRYILVPPRETPVFTMFGAPVSISEDMPDIASAANPIIWGNWGEGYLVVNSALGTMEIVDIYTSKGTGIVEFVLNMWIDGGVLIPEAFKKLTMSVT